MPLEKSEFEFKGHKQQEIFGQGSIQELRGAVNGAQPQRILLVTGRGSFDGLNDQYHILDDLLAGHDLIHFTDFDVNPKIEDVAKGIDLVRQQPVDMVIAIGGGSAIDVAKSINAIAAHDGDPADFATGVKKLERKGKPFIAVPTTSGTGSESTPFAVVYVKGTKYSLSDPTILPDVAIIDPDLTLKLPEKITAATGLDAFSQAIEAYWSVNSTDESKVYSREAIALILSNLAVASSSKPTPESREAMSKGAHLAGKAIAIAQTTACHAVSYPITSKFDVPHGHAVALTLSHMLGYNSGVTKEDCNDSRGPEYVQGIVQDIVTMLGATSVQEARAKIDELIHASGLTTKMKDLDIPQEGIVYIVENGFNPQRVKNNPRALTREALQEILQDIL